MNIIESYAYRKANSITQNEKSIKYIHIYTFKNRKNTQYIVNVEEYDFDVFVIKFHTKSNRQSKNRYCLLTHEKDARRIIFTCIKIGQDIYSKNKNASFGFIGAPLIKEIKEREKDAVLNNTKRFKVYRKFATFFFSPDNFIHSENVLYSSYLLVNKESATSNPKIEDDIMGMFESHFDTNDLFCFN
jgi:hypothetical protein